MRTSKLSRDTARIADALRTSQRSTRASLVQSASTSQNADSVQSAPDIEDLAGPSTPASTRKRKRSALASLPSPAAQEVRTSPRKSGIKIEEPNESTPGHARKAKRQPAKEVKSEDGTTIVEPPAQWEEMYSITAEMRRVNPAPVDTMGCETLAEDGISERDRRFQTLISLMLSSQTKDTVTAAAMRRMQKELPAPGLTLEGILAVEPDKLNEMIWAVGFHNNKTKFIKKTAEVLRDTWDSDIPDTIEGMTSLPGVGPKMAYLCMSAAWGRDEGIGVDVHVHRITNLWGWHKTKTPEETRAALQSWLPKEKWHDINHLLVGFGQTICAPVGRKCGDCKLSEQGLCPSAVVDRKVKAKKVKREGGGSEARIVVKEEDVTVDGSKTQTEAMVKLEGLE